MAMDNPSDDDDISLTSTVESEQASEYFVDTILAEHEFPNDDLRYLVQWDGYNVLRSTWEPKESFNNVGETLLEWEEKKQRISEGKEQAFDVNAWEETCRLLEREKEERKRRRSAKRRKIAASEERRNPTLVKKAGTVQKAAPHRSPNASNHRRPPGPSRLLYSEQGHPARQLAGLPVPRVPPVARFGASQPDPKAMRPRKAFSTDEGERFPTIYRKWKMETYSKNKELPPSADQIDMRRPSDWDSMPAVNANQPGGSHQIPDTKNGVNTENGPRPSLASSVLPRSQPQSPLASSRPDSNLWIALISENDKTVERPRNDIAAKNGPASSKPELNLKIPSREPSGSRSAVGKFNLEFRERKPSYSPKFVPHTYPERWWNLGEVYVTLYVGPEKQEIGDARLCGFRQGAAKGILRKKQRYPPGKIEVWFEHLFTRNQYEELCAEMSNKWLPNGWVEGFNDTEPLIRPVAEQLWKENKIAIAHINSQEILIAYPPGSPDFSSLGQTVQPRGYLSLALRSTIGPIHSLRLIEQISYSRVTGANNAARTGHAESTMVAASDVRKTSRNFDVAQGSIGQPSTASPKLATPDTSTYVSSPTLNSPMSRFPVNISTTREMHASTERMHLDNTPPQALPRGHIGSEPTEAKAGLTKEELDKLFFKRFGITFKKLAFSNGTDKRNQNKAFFVWYPNNPQAVKDEERQLTDFLKNHTVMCFNDSVAGDWEKFMKMVWENTYQGVVLFHESIVQYDKIPQLGKVIRRSTNFWKVSLAKPIQHPDPPLHAQRLFPHGGVYLLTEDFMVREQVAAMIILQWFYEFSRKKNPGTYKLMLRPGIMNWLLDNIKVGDDSQRSQWLAMYHLIQQIGFNASDDIIPPLEQDSLISPPILPKYGFRTAGDSPDIPRDCTQEQRNADHLGEFFAGYALLNSHRFRRFYMITSLEHLTRWKNWNHIEIGGYQEFLRFQAIKPEQFYDRIFKGRSAAPTSANSTPVSPAVPRHSRPAGGSIHEQRSVSLGNQLPSRYGQTYQ